MELNYKGIPILGFAAYSGTGKTTLLIQLVPLLRQRGLDIAVVKHAHHDFDTDQPGKDSYELRKAGATQMLVGSSRRAALIVEHEHGSEPGLQDLLPMLDTGTINLILVEGFKSESFPKIELHRAVLGRPLRCQNDPDIFAVASDTSLPSVKHIPVLDLNRAEEIADFIITYISRRQKNVRAGA
jgi:molybdopterin-guanine dinucleotide biosynthesis protein B